MMALVNEMTALNSIDTVQDVDQDLISRFLEGDESAFSTLVNKYRRQVYAVAWRFTHNHEESDDLAQETFVRAYRNLKSFRREASFKTWLLRITTNLSINLVKSSRVSRDSGETVEDNMSSSNGGALEGMMVNERKAQLQQAIAQLPPKQKETLILKTYRDLTCEEVSKIMNCSPGTVKANIFNALKRLKSILAQTPKEAQK